jgi:phosphopantetheinyl transferase (holo-ACP synthase)/malonyl CoA-acyl carrier protein transacylase
MRGIKNVEGAYACELILVSAIGLDSLKAKCFELSGFLEQAPNISLGDVAYTCMREYLACREEEECKVLAIVTTTVASLRSHLNGALRRLENGATRIKDRSGSYFFNDPLLGKGGGRIAFVLPGAISFYPDMLLSLVLRFSACREAFDELEETMAGDVRFNPSSFIFPPASYYRQDADIFESGAYAEALVSCYSACSGMCRLFKSFGIEADGVTGFAGGDMSGLAMSGAFGDFERSERVEFLRDLYKLADAVVNDKKITPCVMLAVFASQSEKIEKYIESCPKDKVCCALRFSPRQWTLAVVPEFEKEFSDKLTAENAKLRKLAMNRPFNTSWSGSHLQTMRKYSQKWIRKISDFPVYSCGTAKPFSSDIQKFREEAANQWVEEVRFDDTIRQMYEDGFRVFLEAGPRGLLCNSIDEILTGKPHVALAADGIHRVGYIQLLHTLAALASHGAKIDPTPLFDGRLCRNIDFSSPLAVECHTDTGMKLPCSLPTFAFSKLSRSFMEDAHNEAFPTAPLRGRAGKRAAVAAQREKSRQRQFDFGAANPLVSDAAIINQSPGVSLEVTKEFSFVKQPFLADFARGTSQLSYSDPNLKGLTLFPLVVGAEVMAELAQMLIPGRKVVKVTDLMSRRTFAFADGKLKLFIRAERVASGDSENAAVRVQIRDASPDSEWTWPLMEGLFILSSATSSLQPCVVQPLGRPRNVHWTSRDIYPDRLFSGEHLRNIVSAAQWSEDGLNYDVEMPSGAGSVTHTAYPVWALNPLLMAAIMDGFALWRSNAKFGGAFSLAFRLRQLSISSIEVAEKTRFHCYLRFTGVTPRSHLADISVSDGNGNLVMEFKGYEELTERVPEAYGKLILSPATTYLTGELEGYFIGANQAIPVSSAVVTEVPYKLFERNEELWMKTVSQVVLSPAERTQLAEMTGSTNRRTEWMFGRIAAKDAVRRFLEKYFQARWTAADVQIWADDSGKPHPLGEWSSFLPSKIDLAIAHTAQFVVAIVASNARVGVDVEDAGRDLSEEFTRGVFTTDELDLVVAAKNTPSAILRFWCAKEAVSKALGTGIRYSPREMVITSFNPETGAMKMKLEGQWVENFKQFKGVQFDISSSVVRGHVLATCFIAESYFS